MLTRKRKILVTGSTGAVGSYIASIFSKDILFLTSKQTLDITDKKKVLDTLTKINPDIIIHLAAQTNVDECEKNKDYANAVNTQGTANLAEGSKKINAVLLYVSTAAVFNGNKKYYTERDVPNPINEYGKTKYLGEIEIQKIKCKHIIIRAGWIIGGGNKEKKFLSYILQQVRNGKKEIYAVNDKFGTLTYAKDLVSYMKFLLDSKKRGIYHFGALGICSRYTIAKHAMKVLHKDVKVIPVSSTQFADKFFAPRPTNEVLRSTKIPSSFLRHWTKSLTEYTLTELLYE